MHRTQKTHVRKFGGVWYQLVKVSIDNLLSETVCIGCCFIEDLAKCAWGCDCLEDVVFWCGGIWKEIGKI